MQHPFNNVAGSTYVVELHIRYGPTSEGQYKVGGILNGCKQDYGPPVGIHTVSPTIWTHKRNQKLVYHIDHYYVSNTSVNTLDGVFCIDFIQFFSLKQSKNQNSYV